MKRMILALSILVFLSLACATLTGGGNDSNTSGREVVETPTSTPITGGGDSVEPPEESGCAGLNGSLEMQILIGPAEAVGLEPISIGDLSFSVITDEAPYLVQGGGSTTYEATLTEAWGTYTVSFEMETTIDGECGGEPGSEMLNINVEASGDQMVEVRAEGFQGDYPWSGTTTLNLSFPLEDGATSEGEGWMFILHLP
jgi:hypothetical protein